MAGANSNLISAQGNASGSASLAQGNIWNSAVNQLGAAGQKWANTPTTNPDFNGTPMSGYTYKNPNAVGPIPPSKWPQQ
jgi:hypothetical protein